MKTNDQNAEPMIDISRSQIRTDQQPNPHTPICADLYHLPSDLRNIAPKDCRFCIAYAQGRNDLADQIRAVMAPFYESPHGKYLAPLMSKLRTVLGGLDA